MTDDEWQSNHDDPFAMLEAIENRITPREWRLMLCACCRGLRSHLSSEAISAIAIAEDFADGIFRPQSPLTDTRVRLWESIRDVKYDDSAVVLSTRAVIGALHDYSDEIDLTTGFFVIEAAGMVAGRKEYSTHCDIIRDILGNPFQKDGIHSVSKPSVSTEILDIAKAMYSSRTFMRMPELAKLMREHQSVPASSIEHCEAKVEHFRGCWVIDQLLRGDSEESRS